MQIEISKIIIKDRKRKSVDARELAQSIKDIGLLNPITLNKDMVLVAGFHRLQACKLLGWQEIPATIIDVDNLTAELAEIDENLVRTPLSALQNAEQLKRRKEIYELLHPESKAENIKAQNLPKRKDFVSVKPKTFTEDTAQKLGKSTRSIQQDIQIAKNLSPEIRQEIKGTEIENKKSALLEIAKQPAERQKDFFKELQEKKSLPAKENALETAYKVDFIRRRVVVDNKWLDLPSDYDMDDRSYNQMYWDANNYTTKTDMKFKPP